MNAYKDTNAFTWSGRAAIVYDHQRWFHAERYFMRGHRWAAVHTMRQVSRLEDVLGSHGRSAEQLEIWEAVYGPVGCRRVPGAALGQADGTHRSQRRGVHA